MTRDPGRCAVRPLNPPTRCNLCKQPNFYVHGAEIVVCGFCDDITRWPKPKPVAA